MFAVVIASFIVYVRAEKRIDAANEVRVQSLALSEELRRSSDDLTRMVRIYETTGQPIFKQHYQEILDIRDGKAPRPVDYQNTYWDLVTPDNERPRPMGPAIPFLTLLQQAGCTEEKSLPSSRKPRPASCAPSVSSTAWWPDARCKPYATQRGMPSPCVRSWAAS